jgi:hypothetical protein
VVRNIEYTPGNITYKTFDTAATELLRLTTKPVKILAAGEVLPETDQLSGDSWTWTPLATGGVLRINHKYSNEISILLK